MNNNQTTPAAAAAAPAKATKAPRISAAAASKFQPSAKLRRAINSNVSAAEKVGRSDVSVTCAASILIHELHNEVKLANKGISKKAPTYVHFADSVGDLFGINKVDYSRTYKKLADAIFAKYSGDADLLSRAYLETTPKRPSVSGLLEFIKDETETEPKEAPIKVTFNLTSGKVTGATELSAAQLKKLKTLFNEFTLSK